MNFGSVIVREDGSYVINEGLYHVPNEGEFKDLWTAVDQYVAANPDKVTRQVEQEQIVPELTPEQIALAIQQQLTDAVQRLLDNEAKQLNYDSCLSVCSYVDTGVEKFDNEGRAFRIWRSKVWEKCYEILAEVQAGEREIPTADQLIEMLPKLEL